MNLKNLKDNISKVYCEYEMAKTTGNTKRKKTHYHGNVWRK